MIVTLFTEPFIIQFNLLGIIKLNETKKLYKFSIKFTHFENLTIQFSLPDKYQMHLTTTDLIRLIDVLSDKIKALIKGGDKQEKYLIFDKNSFVNSEYDIEICVDSGEYYSDEDDGVLNLMFFFNINVAYHHAGVSMIGLQARIMISELQTFIGNLRNLAKS